jgi:hypothetical protein
MTRQDKAGSHRGEAKLNTDGAYTANGAGMVLRNHQGEVIFTACCTLEYYRDDVIGGHRRRPEAEPTLNGPTTCH